MRRSAQLASPITPNDLSNRQSQFFLCEARSRLATRQAKLMCPNSTIAYDDYQLMREAAWHSLLSLSPNDLYTLDQQHFPEFYI